MDKHQKMYDHFLPGAPSLVPGSGRNGCDRAKINSEKQSKKHAS